MDYLFIINGEYAFVEVFDLDEAYEILADNFDFAIDEVEYTGEEYTPEEAEVLGYDTY